MKTFRFRDFIIYTEARDFRKIVCQSLRSFPSSEQFRLVDQIHRSCLSIVLNIAEGSAKQSDKDFARFLEMAIASLNEVVAGFDVAHDDEIVQNIHYELLEKQAEQLTRRIGKFIQSLRQKRVVYTKNPMLEACQKPIANCQ
jgi:four helix bundle protein